MKMAKATKEDMDAAMLLLGILEDVDSGRYPRRVDGTEPSEDLHDDDCEPGHFRPDQEDHLRAFYDRVMHCVRVRPSGISRVIWGFDTIMFNNILDPDKKTLELHPRFKDVSAEALELEEERRC
jgi:hypothetical protein